MFESQHGHRCLPLRYSLLDMSNDFSARVLKMRAEGKPQRTYDSPRRRQQAAASRQQILTAAHRLFEGDGYAATSMAAIALQGGVSLKTVYVVFETKSGLLRALWHRVLRGDRNDTPVGEQPWFRRVIDEPDARVQLRL